MPDQRIVIPNYPDKVQIAKARRPKYYVSGTSKVKGNKKIPKRYQTTDYAFDPKGILYNVNTKEAPLANPRTAGTPRYWVVNFQDIWNQNLTKQSRAAKVNLLKDILRPHLEKVKVIKKFPIMLSLHIYDVDCPVDISNRGAVYTKVIEDLLVSLGKIPDDSVEYINCSGGTSFWKIEDVKDKRMVISIRSNQ